MESKKVMIVAIAVIACYLFVPTLVFGQMCCKFSVKVTPLPDGQ